MATVCLSNPKSFLPSSSSSFSTSIIPKVTTRKQIIVCKAENNVIISKRSLSISLASSLLLSLAGNGTFNANAAILEADEDDELMEKVKKDRKKRLERQGIINSSSKEKGTNKFCCSSGFSYLYWSLTKFEFVSKDRALGLRRFLTGS